MNHCFIIAEAGVNHNGDIDLAHQLIDIAADAGANAVKFQTFNAEELVTSSAPKASYQIETTNRNESQLKMLQQLQLATDAYPELIEHCRKRGIYFSSTPFDIKSIEFLDKLGVPFHKIPSGEITNFPLIRNIAKQGKPVILSTGMANTDEVKAAVGWLSNNSSDNSFLPPLTVLHCVSAYPAPYEDINLSCLSVLANELSVPIGLSDHSQGIAIPIAAVAMGATVIEKHFTVSHSLEGPDHRASLEPDELRAMIEGIRNVEKAIGNGIKNLTPSEEENITIIRRSIVAKRNIKAGETFTEENLATKRPATGLSPALWNSILGQKAKRMFVKDENIEL